MERVRRFLEACEIDRNLSPLTIRQYDHYLTYFLGWVAREQPDVKDLPDLTSEVVRRYKLALARHRNVYTGRPLSRATQTYFLIALRSMLRYWTLQGLEVLAPDRIELGKATSRSLKFLDPDQLRRLLAAPDLNDPRGPRDRALMETFFSTGLRLAELARLDAEEIEVVLATERLDPLTLVEDELLLSLPFSPRHADGECDPASPMVAGHESSQSRSSPFGQLGELKKTTR